MKKRREKLKNINNEHGRMQVAGAKPSHAHSNGNYEFETVREIVSREITGFVSDHYKDRVMKLVVSQFVNFLFEEYGHHRQKTSVDVPPCLQPLVSVKKVQAPFIEIKGEYDDVFYELGIIVQSGHSQYLRGPVSNLFMRLSFLPAAITHFRELYGKRGGGVSVDPNEEEFRYHVQGDPPALLSENEHQLIRTIPNIVLQRDPITGERRINIPHIQQTIPILTALREIEGNYMGATNTDRYLNFLMLSLSSNYTQIVATTADILLPWELGREDEVGKKRNPLMPFYFEILSHGNPNAASGEKIGINPGRLFYFVNGDEVVRVVESANDENLRSGFQHLEKLVKGGVRVRVGPIPEPLRYVSIITRTALGLTIREQQIRSLVISRSTDVGRYQELFFSAFSKGVDINELIVKYDLLDLDDCKKFKEQLIGELTKVTN